MEKTITIALSGPESSGKTTLCQALAKHFDASYVPEYAREYLKDLGTNYSFDDVIEIAKKQMEMEDMALANKPKLLFLDTDMINFKIWFEFYGNKTPNFIEERIKNNPYTLTLLLYPNTPWIDDGLRQNENNRLELFHQFKEELNHYYYSFQIIDKLDKQRIKQAKNLVSSILNKY